MKYPNYLSFIFKFQKVHLSLEVGFPIIAMLNIRLHGG